MSSTTATASTKRFSSWADARSHAPVAGEATAPPYVAEGDEVRVAESGADLLAGMAPEELRSLTERALVQLSEDPEALLSVADQAISRLAADPLAGSVDEADLAVHVGRLHRLGRRVSAELHRRVAELDDRRAWTLLGCRSTADWLSSTLAMTGYEAKTVVDTARVLGQLPKTAARFAAGELDVAQVQAAAKAHADLERLQSLAEAAAEDTDDGVSDADGAGEGLGARGVDDPAGEGTGGGGGAGGGGEPSGGGDPWDWEPIWDRGRSAAEIGDAADAGSRPPDLDGARAELDELLAEQAEGQNRAQTRATVTDWQHTLDERYGIEREQRAWRRRGGVLGTNADEGTGWARFELDAVGIATVKAALEPLARKTRADDDRTHRQRLADALVGLCQQALDAPDTLPETAGGRPQVLVITTLETLDGSAKSEPAHLDGVGAVSSATAQMLACDGTVTEVVVDGFGQPLQVRETTRVTAAQRQAVIARDRGCIGCGASVTRTQMHHVQYRRNHGATVVENLALVCFGCHRHIHHHDWRVIAGSSGYRLVPPWHRDADQGIRQRPHCGRHPR